MNDPTQKLATPSTGQPITASMLRQISEKIVGSIRGGKGIVVTRAADNLIIQAQAQTTTSSGSGAYTVDTVETLPAIPTSGILEVFWTSEGAGTGDDQVWRAYAGQALWSATQLFTTKSGAPPT